MKKNIIFLLICCTILLSMNLPAQDDYNIYGKWARKTGLISSDYKSNVAVEKIISDSEGNVYISGNSYGVVSFTDDTCYPTKLSGYEGTGNYEKYRYPPVTGPFIEGTHLRKDGWISKYNSIGEWVWTIRVASNVFDNCTYMCLSPDEEKLVFITTFAYPHDGGIQPIGIPTITYGDGYIQPLEITDSNGNVAATPGEWGNYALIGVNTSDGSRRFMIDKGPTGSPPKYASVGGIYAVGDYFYLQSFWGAQPNYMMNTQRYNFNGVYLSQVEHQITNTAPVSALAISPNKTGPFAYTVMRMAKTTGVYPNATWYYDISLLRTNASTMVTDVFSSISSTAQHPTIDNQSHLHGILARGVEINSANSHLFVAGYTLYTFTYLGNHGLGTVHNQGGRDGIIVCYDPTKNYAHAGHIRWWINLRNAGEQAIMGTTYDNNAQLLRVVGYIDENDVNFNPRGQAMIRRSKKGLAMFYASYDNDGNCKNVTIIDGEGPGNDQAHAVIQPTNDEIVVFGTFQSSPFPVDPADKISPLRSTETSNFMAKYSLTELEPDPPFAASYSAANKIKETYGVARHTIQSCLSIGDVNASVDYGHNFFPQFYKGGAVNSNYDGFNDIKIGTGVPANGITVTVEAINDKETSAFLAGWIDFNENGEFDEDEVSEIVRIPGEVGEATAYELTWTLPAGVNPRLSTFMRIRLTSESMDGTWAAGDAADGEVEDYHVKFNFLVPVNSQVKTLGIND